MLQRENIWNCARFKIPSSTHGPTKCFLLPLRFRGIHSANHLPLSLFFPSLCCHFQLFHKLSPPFLGDVMLFKQACRLFTATMWNSSTATTRQKPWFLSRMHIKIWTFVAFSAPAINWWERWTLGVEQLPWVHIASIKTVKQQVLFALLLVFMIKTPDSDKLRSGGHVLRVVAGCETGHILFLWYNDKTWSPPDSNLPCKSNHMSSNLKQPQICVSLHPINRPAKPFSSWHENPHYSSRP